MPTRWTEGLINHLGEIVPTKQIIAAKNYARSGHVIELNVSPGLVDAKVQGRRRTPYSVRLYAPKPDDRALENVLRKLCEKAIYKIALLMGEIPAELDEIFKSSGVTLSLTRFNRIQRLCSCSEPEEVCKHILAVIYVMAAAFDRDPFMLMKLRGLDKKFLLELLCAPVGSDISMERTLADMELEQRAEVLEISPNSASLAMGSDFYGSPELPAVLDAPICPTADAAYQVPILDFPLWRGDVSFADSIAPYYKTVKKFIAGGAQP
jgi:uncharacterized Zn finger protein